MNEKTPAVVVKKELILEGDPDQQLEFAHKAAKALMSWVAQKPKKVMIRGEQFLEFSDWQIIGRFYGSTVSIDWAKPLLNAKGDGIRGYEARAVVLRNGEVIASAEAMCTRAEKNWSGRDEFMLRSMAQTRASAKALRQAFGWVAELAGMRTTPAEEMGEVYDQSPIPDKAVPTVTYDNPEDDMPETIPELDESGLPTNVHIPVRNDKPWQKADPQKLTIGSLKRTIKDLCDKITMVELEGTQEYHDYVLSNTGLVLADQSIENLKAIVERLEAFATK